MIIGILGGILGAVGIVASIIFGTIAYRRAHKQDIASDASVEAILKVDINYIKEGIDDIKSEQHRTADNMGRLAERVTRVEESVKSAHRRLDQHLGTYPAEDDTKPCDKE